MPTITEEPQAPPATRPRIAFTVDCIDCAGRLTPNGTCHVDRDDRHLRETATCDGCGRRYAIDITLTPYPKARKGQDR